jgi:hypothetical protein
MPGLARQETAIDSILVAPLFGSAPASGGSQTLHRLAPVSPLAARRHRARVRFIGPEFSVIVLVPYSAWFLREQVPRSIVSSAPAR